MIVSLKCDACGREIPVIDYEWILAVFKDHFNFSCPNCGHVITAGNKEKSLCRLSI